MQQPLSQCDPPTCPRVPNNACDRSYYVVGFERGLANPHPPLVHNPNNSVEFVPREGTSSYFTRDLVQNTLGIVNQSITGALRASLKQLGIQQLRYPGNGDRGPLS